MNPNIYLDELFKRYPELSNQKDNILSAYFILENLFLNKGKLLVGGNGGSASDSNHIVSELMKGFTNIRKLSSKEKEIFKNLFDQEGLKLADNLQGSLPAISLVDNPSFITAFNNDCDSNFFLAQQIYGLGKENDVLLIISTSGNSKNAIYAAMCAKAKSMKVISLTGANDSKLSEISDVSIRSNYTETYKIQEHHLPIYHCLCLMLEDKFFKNNL